MPVMGNFRWKDTPGADLAEIAPEPGQLVEDTDKPVSVLKFHFIRKNPCFAI